MDQGETLVTLFSKVFILQLQLMMTLWGKELNERGEDDKMTLRGKMDSGTFTQVIALTFFTFFKCLM